VNPKRVAIAGGGLIGCAIAWKLAQRGVRVDVIESAQPGQGASSAAAGMLAPLIESHHPAFQSLASASNARFPQFVDELRAESGIDAELQVTGKIDVAFSQTEFDKLRAGYGAKLPDGVREVSREDVRALEPEVSSELSAALVSDGDGSVDNRKLMRAALIAATNAGAVFHPGSSVREVLCSRVGFEAVHLSTGERLDADAVVIAAGAWSSSIRGLPQSLPTFPVRGQMVAVERVPRLLSRLVMSLDCYLVPRSDGRILIGSTVERAGFDARTTAAGIAYLLNAAIRLVPAIAEASVVETWAGLRPGTPDDLPIIGADPRAGGVFHATGHFRNGILLAPITADVITALVLGERPDVDISAFSVGRFHD
jgi:glycine oxidase